ncbi:MAG: FtsX-like permease family protein [Azospirillaceae bacterium]|nr:FtsX-like permease family protein [Azospirillaceae bacterium]
MMTFKIAYRNILRNRRRSSMTLSAIAVGAVAMLLFGAFMSFLVLGFQTTTVRNVGHLSIFRAGYFAFGTGNPAAYGIADHQVLEQLITHDAVLGPLVKIATPRVTLYGIAGNFDIDASKTFIGIGVVPADREKMQAWNDYHLPGRSRQPSALRDDDPTRGVIGIGMARILGLCQPLGVTDCPTPPKLTADAAPVAAPDAGIDLSELSQRDHDPAQSGTEPALPRIDLLAATAGGAPNIVSLNVAKAESQSVKELDDSFVGLHIALAQQLLYGRGTPKVTAIALQLFHTSDMTVARARLLELFKAHNLDLEVRDFTELTPQYNQVIGLFGSIFVFIAVIMAVIVLFTVVNTMTMSVMERTNEIGTARAMGVRRRGIHHQFLIEGCLLGLFGATIGVLLAAVIAVLVNQAGLTWMPPGESSAIPLHLLISGVPALILGTWLGLIAMATVGALLPANRAARMPIVDALRHV